MLGVHFDTSLHMVETVTHVRDEASWKLQTILRTNRYYDVESTLNLYKSRVLGFIEYRTSAIYHCAENLPQRLDAVQDKICNSVGISPTDALVYFYLSPLNTRRDISMPGLIQRSVLGGGPSQFQ